VIDKPPYTNLGFIALHRKIRDHWIWKDPEKFQWWVDILMECNHTNQKVLFGYETLECNRGQSLNSLDTWAKRWRVDTGRVRRFFELLENEKMIRRENVKKTTRLTICNYDTYNRPRQSNDTQTDSEQISNEFRTTTNNNVLNGNNEKKERGAHALFKYKNKEQKETVESILALIRRDYSSLAKLKEPFMPRQLIDFMKEYPGPFGQKIFNHYLKRMHNRKDLHKNRSAYHTMSEWIRTETDEEILGWIQKCKGIHKQLADEKTMQL
jgi:hypothetical protein